MARPKKERPVEDETEAQTDVGSRVATEPRELREDYQATQDPRDPLDPRTDEQKNRDLRDQPRDPLIGIAPIDHSKADAKRAEREKAEREEFAKRADKSNASTETSADREAAKKGDKPAKITVTFTGDPKGGLDPVVAEYGGKSFPKGEAVKIEDASWIEANANIRKNNHFRVE